MFDLIIDGASIAGTSRLRQATIAIKGGKIAALLEPSETVQAAERISAKGCVVLPGLIDVHVHFREPGFTQKEDFSSGSAGAAVGGVTSVMVMPTDKPMTTTPELFLEKRALAEGKCYVDFALQAGLGPDISHVRALKDLGAISFEVFLADLVAPMLVATGEELRQCLLAVSDCDAIAGITPGDDSIVAAHTYTSVTGQLESRRAFLASRPPLAEALSLAKALVAANALDTRVHIRQVSTAPTLDVLRRFKRPGISAEVTPHNLLLEDLDVLKLGAKAKVTPPLRDHHHLLALQQGLRDGVIDMVATDHAPHRLEEKALGEIDLWKAPGGFPGVQTLLPLMLHMVEKRLIDYPMLVRSCCEIPARTFGIFPQKGWIGPGADADLVVVDPSKPMTIRDQDQLSRAQATPFHGWEIRSSTILTLLRGKIIAREGKPTGSPVGRFLKPG